MRLLFVSTLLSTTLLSTTLLSSCGEAVSAAQPQAVPGSPVQRCINMGNTLEAPTEGEWGHTATERDFDRIRALGFDTVRLPVAWSEHLDGRGRIEPAFLARVDEVVRWGEARGLNVIVNVHHFRELDTDAQAHIPTLVGIWDQLAVHYRNASPRVIFEVVNEPSGDFGVERVNRANRDILARIRRTNPDRWVVLGSAHWGTIVPFERGADPAFRPVDDPRTVATFHSYTPYTFTHQGAEFAPDPPPVGRGFGSRADLRAVASELDAGADFSVRSGMPVLLGEFGTYGKTIPLDARLRYTRAVREGAESRGLGWCAWDWAGAFRIYEADTDTVLPGFGDALGL